MGDIKPRKEQTNHGNQYDPMPGVEIPGDTDAPDIVGRTGEEMPEVAHDEGDGELRDDLLGALPERAVPRKHGKPFAL